MVDLELLDNLKLSSSPFGQKVVSALGLRTNYHITHRVEIVIEGQHNIPTDRAVIFAMNHTDKYNYWPFQYQLAKTWRRYTATWVKAKYYEHPVMRSFMTWTNNIPTVSRGYLITKDFLGVTGRRPSRQEYGEMRRLVEDPTFQTDLDLPQRLFSEPRHILGLDFHPDRDAWPLFMGRLFTDFMRRFVALNRQALDVGADLIIFPQGTRSIRLSKGHIGLGAIALALKATVVPVGCSGSDGCYPGTSPWARSGRIVYRVGAPMTYEDMARHHVGAPFAPFTPEAEAAHRDKFQGFVDEVMERINDLVEPRYRFSEDRNSDGVSGTNRFV